jgi:hypothetical protein
MAKALRLLSRLQMQIDTDPRHFGEPTQCGSVTTDEYGVSVVQGDEPAPPAGLDRLGPPGGGDG